MASAQVQRITHVIAQRGQGGMGPPAMRARADLSLARSWSLYRWSWACT